MKMIDYNLLKGKITAMQSTEPEYAFNFLNNAQNPSTEWECIEDMLESMEVYEAEPVKRGRWIDCTFYDPYEKSYEQNFKYKCSCCGHMIYNKPNDDDNLFCGHCSARMIKDGDTE